MADKSRIEWTDTTWNVVTGCSVVSPGCTNCYAMRMAGTRLKTTKAYSGLTQDTKAGPVWTGEVRLLEERLTQPLKWRKPRMVFVNSMGDLFHEGVADEWIDYIFAVMALSPQHIFQVLTKRPERMRTYVSRDRGGREISERLAEFYVDHPQIASRWPLTIERAVAAAHWPLPNVWLGTSVEDQARADERIPHLLDTPAAVRFLSCEPLLGLIDLREISTAGVGAAAGNKMSDCLHWVICGGESGPNARPMHPNWARSLRDQCQAAEVAFFFKQWGGWVSQNQAPDNIHLGDFPSDTFEQRPMIYSADTAIYRVGKKRAGRLLDGREWNQYPEAA